MNNSKPLITFALVAYNQERFIREAIGGAFSQTYSPLEIILSDDCSSDSTFEIMKELAEGYKGHHKIILNRNEKNLGIGGHINRIMELAKGELIVGAAGDDISLPERTSITFDAYVKSDKKAMSIYGRAIIIDENSNKIKLFSSPLHPEDAENLMNRVVYQCSGIQGCSHAWHRNVFEVFGPIINSVMAEDRVIPFRSYALGTVLCLEEDLVLYRIHSNNIYKKNNFIYKRNDHIEYSLKLIISESDILKQYQNDLQHSVFMEKYSEETLQAVNNYIHNGLTRLNFKKLFLRSNKRNKILLLLKSKNVPITLRERFGMILRIFAPFLFDKYMEKHYRNLNRTIDKKFWQSLI